MKLFEINHQVDPNMAADVIINHCKPFLEQINYDPARYPIYRGVHTKDKPHMQVDARTGLRTIRGHNPNRKPLDTPPEVHNELNRIYKEMFGLPFRNGTFVSGSYPQSTGYGDMTVVVLPIGNFNFLWSPKVEDALVGYDIDARCIKYKYNKSVLSPEYLQDKTDDNDYQTTNLPSAILSRHEIMLYCDSCIILRTKADNPLAVFHEISSTMIRNKS